jgi:hypothetical protein
LFKTRSNHQSRAKSRAQSTGSLPPAAITATLDTLAAGRITAQELPIATGERQRTDAIRIAPGFSTVDRGQWKAGSLLPPNAYTTDALAKFLGEVNESDGKATESFKATFGALELINANGLKEGDVAGLDVYQEQSIRSRSNTR